MTHTSGARAGDRLVAMPRPRRALRVVAMVGLALVAASCASAFAACDAKPGAMRVASPGAVVLFQSRPSPIKVGELFALDVEVCATKGEVRGVAIDATMPEHKHGMNYRPVVKKSAGNTWGATGFMFHMPGRWQFAFEVDTGAGRERVLHNLTVE